MMENDERLLIIGDLDDNTPVHAAGDLVEIQLFQREYTDIHDFLLEACMMCMDASRFINYSEFLVEDSGQKVGYDNLLLFRLKGTIVDSSSLLNTLKEMQELRKDECFGDYVEEMAQTMEEKPWLHEDCPLPALFRATRIEQLFYWIHWEDITDDQCKECAQDLVELDPDLRKKPIVSQYL